MRFERGHLKMSRSLSGGRHEKAESTLSVGEEAAVAQEWEGGVGKEVYRAYRTCTKVPKWKSSKAA